MIYYAYRQCDGSISSLVILQPMLAFPNMVLGDVVMFNNGGKYNCWELINNSGTLSQYLGQYLNTYNSLTNYFTEIADVIPAGETACKKCIENATILSTPKLVRCELDFSYRNDCIANNSGKVYLNSALIYEWIEGSPIVSYNQSITINSGDIITISTIIDTNSSFIRTIVNNNSLGDAIDTTVSVSNSESPYNYSYKLYCGKTDIVLKLENICKL